MWFAFFSTSDSRGFSSALPLLEFAFSDPSRFGDDILYGFSYVADLPHSLMCSRMSRASTSTGMRKHRYSLLLLHLEEQSIFRSRYGVVCGTLFSSQVRNKHLNSGPIVTCTFHTFPNPCNSTLSEILAGSSLVPAPPSS